MEQNLSLYKIFYHVASAGNISHAANELYISQPAISKSIRKLEENLNVKLFLRNSKGVLLTDEGRLLFDSVKTAFDTLSFGEEQIRQVNELGIGHLRIGVSTTLCKYMLLPYLEEFIKLHPHIKITIECQSTNYTLQLLEQNKIDIGLIGSSKSSHGFHFHKIGEIQDCFVTTNSYIENLTLRNQDNQQDIFKTATLMLLNKENMSRQFIDQYLTENRIEINHILEISTMDLLIEFAKIGLGVACVIKEFVQEEIDNRLLVEIPLPAPIHKRSIGFSYKKNAGLSHSVEEFIEFCMKSDYLIHYVG